jgi:hypothetical protein
MAPTNNNKENDPKNSSKKEGKVKRVKTQAQRDRQNKSIFKKRHAEQALVGASDAFIKAKQFMLKKNAADATATAAPFAATATATATAAATAAAAATATAAAAATATNPSTSSQKSSAAISSQASATSTSSKSSASASKTKAVSKKAAPSLTPAQITTVPHDTLTSTTSTSTNAASTATSLSASTTFNNFGAASSSFQNAGALSAVAESDIEVLDRALPDDKTRSFADVWEAIFPDEKPKGAVRHNKSQLCQKCLQAYNRRTTEMVRQNNKYRAKKHKLDNLCLGMVDWRVRAKENNWYVPEIGFLRDKSLTTEFGESAPGFMWRKVINGSADDPRSYSEIITFSFVL